MCYTYKPKGRFPLHNFRTLGCEARFFLLELDWTNSGKMF